MSRSSLWRVQCELNRHKSPSSQEVHTEMHLPDNEPMDAERQTTRMYSPFFSSASFFTCCAKRKWLHHAFRFCLAWCEGGSLVCTSYAGFAVMLRVLL